MFISCRWEKVLTITSQHLPRPLHADVSRTLITFVARQRSARCRPGSSWLSTPHSDCEGQIKGQITYSSNCNQQRTDANPRWLIKHNFPKLGTVAVQMQRRRFSIPVYSRCKCWRTDTTHDTITNLVSCSIANRSARHGGCNGAERALFK